MKIEIDLNEDDLDVLCFLDEELYQRSLSAKAFGGDDADMWEKSCGLIGKIKSSIHKKFDRPYLNKK